MGCGCKNKNSGVQNKQTVNQTPPPQSSNNQNNQSKNNPALQDSIKRIVERYYKKK